MRVIQTDDTEQLQALAKQLAGSKRVAIICGAGISTAAGIPDFRTAATGLFASLKEKNPDLKINSGKDLFHTNLFQREDTTRAFYQMCAEMKRMATAAPPTDFHLLMKDLDDAGKLFRIYTQNIDSLEAKAGLSFGLGEWQERERLVSRRKAKGKSGKKGMSQKAKGKQRAIEVEEELALFPNPAGESFPTHTPPSDPPQLDYLMEHVPQGELVCESSSLASASHSPHLAEPIDDVRLLQPRSTTFSLGKSNQSEGQSSSTLGRRQISPSPNTCPPPISGPRTMAGASEVCISSSNVNLHHQTTADTAVTVVVPDSQEQGNTTMDSSTLTNLSSLTDMSISEILQMPFCSQGSSVCNDKEAQENDCILGNLPSLALTADESITAERNSPQVPVPQEQPEQEAPVPKQITIQRFLTVPSVIPLHGTLDEMHCPKCQHVELLEHHLQILESGHSIHCPKCLEQDHSRIALGERSRGVGVLKVSVVLYGEEHKQASRVGEIAEKDLLKAARPDVLIVAGTTLRIPGVKKIVKELSKVIKQPIREEVKDEQGNPTGEFKERIDPSKRVIFVNRDAPNPERTWGEVFDTFVQGDAQTFAKLVREEIQALKNPPAPVPVAQAAATSATTGVQAVAKSVAQVQNSLTTFWNASKSTGPAAVMAGKPVAVPLVWEPVRNTPEAADSQPTPQVLAGAKQTKAKQAKSIGQKATSSTSRKKQKVPKLATPPGDLRELLTTKGGNAAANPAKKAKKSKRAPVKSVAQVQAELAKKAKAIQKPTPANNRPAQKEKEKSKPGWKGYALVEESAVKKSKPFDDFFAGAIVEGSRRRRTTTLAAPSTTKQSPASVPSTNEEARATTPVIAAAETQTTPHNAQSSDDIVLHGFPPLKGSSWPASAHPSMASTPPSLYSDRETMSDSDETASYKGEYEAIGISQETMYVPPSFSAEHSVPEVLSMSREIETVRTSSPVVVQDSLESAIFIDTPASSSCSSSQTSSASQAGLKRSHSQISSLVAFNHAVHTTHEPSSAKRMKVEM